MSRDLPGITPVQTAVSRLAGTVGHESPIVRWLRPAYETGLLWLSAGRGIRWSINGVPCRIDPRQRHRLPRVYETAVADFLADRIHPNAVCLDVGANVGAYVLQMAFWVQPAGRVYAFEPNPAAARILERHLRYNRLQQLVDIVPMAVGAACGEQPFYATDADGMSRLHEPNPLVADRAKRTTVPITSIDRFCKERDLVPDWIVIDIEGFEYAALDGARETITRHDTGVVVEMHPSTWSGVGSNAGEFHQLLEAMGRRPVSLSGQGDPLREYGAVSLEPA